MDNVAQMDAAQRKELFSETAVKMNLLPGLIEKDFWVCWTLQHLFSIPAFQSHLLFKGGTTLSKIFGVIERFSEDIDLAVDWEMLGFTGDRSPLNDLSTKKRNKLTILHQEHYRTADRNAPGQYSHHYYDVFMMAKRDEVRQIALGNPELLARVVEHKKLFFPRAWARYDLAVPATLQLQPSSSWIDFLRRDYESMQVMFFGAVPSFDDILSGLQDLENAIRNMVSIPKT